MRDVILKLPAWLDDAQRVGEKSTVTVIYFITGNPGLIHYYSRFLDLLIEGSGKHAIIAGASLAGFERGNENTDPVNKIERELLWPETYTRKQLYNLRDQIDITELRLQRLIENVKQSYGGLDNATFHVILVGHSVGAYIALEVVKSCHAHFEDQPMPFTIAATMLLTPTIHDISVSPSGKIATPVLSNIPFFPALVQAGASTLASTLPTSWLNLIVTRVTGMTGDALDTTVSFLQTPGAVKQALFMAKCEMLEIGPNQWTDDVWGVVNHHETSNGGQATICWKAPKHYFLFAKEDHWVANVTRQSIVKDMHSRGRIIVDSDAKLGLVHAWCLNQSEMVADIVEDWLGEIVTSLD